MTPLTRVHVLTQFHYFQVNKFQRIEISSTFLLSSGADSTASTSTSISTQHPQYTWGALAVGSSTPLAGRVGLLFATTNMDCSIKAT